MRRDDNLTTFMCRLSRNLGTSTSWNPKELSRPVMGLPYFLHMVVDSLASMRYVHTNLSPGVLFCCQSDRPIFSILFG
jgi:hypothetical protein